MTSISGNHGDFSSSMTGRSQKASKWFQKGNNIYPDKTTENVLVGVKTNPDTYKFYVVGTSKFEGNVVFIGSIEHTGNLIVDGNTTLKGGATLESTLNVSDITTLTTLICNNTATFNRLATFEYPIVANSTLSVSDTTTLTSLICNNTATFNKTATFEYPIVANSTLNVSDTTTLTNLLINAPTGLNSNVRTAFNELTTRYDYDAGASNGNFLYGTGSNYESVSFQTKVRNELPTAMNFGTTAGGTTSFGITTQDNLISGKTLNIGAGSLTTTDLLVIDSATQNNGAAITKGIQIRGSKGYTSSFGSNVPTYADVINIYNSNSGSQAPYLEIIDKNGSNGASTDILHSDGTYAYWGSNSTQVNFGTSAESNITMGRAQNTAGTALQYTNDCSNQYMEIATGGYFRVAKGYVTSGVSPTNAGLDVSSIGTLRSNGSLSCDGDIGAGDNKLNIYGNTGNLITSGTIETYQTTETAGMILTKQKNTTTGAILVDNDMREEDGMCIYQESSGTNYDIIEAIRLGRADQGNQIVINDIAGARYGIATGSYNLGFRKSRAWTISSLSRTSTTATGTASGATFAAGEIWTISGVTSSGDYWNATHTLISGSTGTTFKFTINASATASPTITNGVIETIGTDDDFIRVEASGINTKGNAVDIKILAETQFEDTSGGVWFKDMVKSYFGTTKDYSLFFDDTGASGGVHNHLQLEALTGNDFNFQWNGDGSTENNLKYDWYISNDPTDSPMNLYNYTGGTWSSPIMKVMPNATRDNDAITMKNNAIGLDYTSIGVMNDGASTLRYSRLVLESPTQGYWRNMGIVNICDDDENDHRATMENRTVYDEGAEFFFSGNGKPRWDLSSRPSGDSYSFRFYSNTTVAPADSWTPSFGSGSNMCLQITTVGDCTANSFTPFTGCHTCKINDTIDYQEGLIVEVEDSEVRDVNNSNFSCKLCDTPNSKCVLGVISHRDRPYHRTPLEKDTDPFPEGTFMYNWAVNSVGEGAIWITDFNGEIDKGDLIVSSEISGYGMCQKTAKGKDDIIRSKTIAKCMKLINWANITDTIIHNGFTYKKVLCPCIYMCG